MLFNKKAQSTLEYAVIIAVVVAGLIAMQTYIKRGLQGKLKQASDDIGEQFSPGITTGTVNVTSQYSTTEDVTLNADKPTTTTKTRSLSPERRTTHEDVGAFDQEIWPR